MRSPLIAPLVIDKRAMTPSFCEAKATIIPPPIRILNGKNKRFHVLGGRKNAFPASIDTASYLRLTKPWYI